MILSWNLSDMTIHNIARIRIVLVGVSYYNKDPQRLTAGTTWVLYKIPSRSLGFPRLKSWMESVATENCSGPRARPFFGMKQKSGKNLTMRSRPSGIRSGSESRKGLQSSNQPCMLRFKILRQRLDIGVAGRHDPTPELRNFGGCAPLTLTPTP